MDPLTIGFFLVASFLVIALILYMFQSFGKETDFEEAYGRSALRLLADDRSSKPKSLKSSRKSKATVERKKEAVGEKELIKNATIDKKYGESQAVLEPATADDWKNLVNTETKQRKKGRKRVTEDSPKSQTSSDSLQDAKELPVKAVEKKLVVNEQHMVEENMEPVHKVGEKKIKKKKVQKLEESQPQSSVIHEEEEYFREEQVPLEISNMKAALPKVRSNKVVPVVFKEITEDSLLSRFKEIEAIEPEYISYLAKHFSDNNTQRKKLNDELGTLRKQCADREKLVAQCNEKLAVVSKKDAEIEELRRIIDEERKKFSDEKANYSMFEKTVRAQLAQNIQEKKQMQQALDKNMAELGTVKQDLLKANATIHASPSIDVVKQGDLLRNEVNSLKGIIQQREAELKQKNQMIEQMLSETKELKRKVDLLTQSNSLTAQRAQEIEAQAENARRSFEEKLQRADQTATELQMVLKDKTEIMERMLEETRRRAADLEKQVLIAENGAKESEREKQRLLQENLHYKSDFSTLEEAHKIALDEVTQEMEELRKQNEGDKATVSSKLKEANEKIAVLSELNGKLDDVRKQLEREVDAVKSREESVVKELMDEKKKYEEMKAMIEEKENAVRCLENKLETATSLKTSNGQVEPEVAKTVTGVQKAEATESISELSKLQERLLCQERKNEELRSSNYQLVEVAHKQEQNLLKKMKDIEAKNSTDIVRCLEETKKILQHICHNEEIPPIPKKPEINIALTWLQDAKDCCSLKLANHLSTASNCAAHTDNGDDDVDKELLKLRVEKYRSALAAVSTSIKVIEREAAARKNCYKKEIAKLRAQLAKVSSTDVL